MNTVKFNKVEAKNYLLETLVLRTQSKETAFIGRCGSGPTGLYLITYGRIVLANDPSSTYDCWDCSVSVDKFVDITIIVNERA